jgi:hypothetical protein
MYSNHSNTPYPSPKASKQKDLYESKGERKCHAGKYTSYLVAD